MRNRIGCNRTQSLQHKTIAQRFPIAFQRRRGGSGGGGGEHYPQAHNLRSPFCCVSRVHACVCGVRVSLSPCPDPGVRPLKQEISCCTQLVTKSRWSRTISAHECMLPPSPDLTSQTIRPSLPSPHSSSCCTKGHEIATAVHVCGADVSQCQSFLFMCVL